MAENRSKSHSVRVLKSEACRRPARKLLTRTLRHLARILGPASSTRTQSFAGDPKRGIRGVGPCSRRGGHRVRTTDAPAGCKRKVTHEESYSALTPSMVKISARPLLGSVIR